MDSGASNMQHSPSPYGPPLSAPVTVLATKEGMEWKRIADLNPGDDVRGWGVVSSSFATSRSEARYVQFGTMECSWPSDAYVAVVKPKPVAWKQTVTYMTTNADVAKRWTRADRRWVANQIEFERGDVTEVYE